MCKKA